jgi:hypothetical protein
VCQRVKQIGAFCSKSRTATRDAEIYDTVWSLKCHPLSIRLVTIQIPVCNICSRRTKVEHIPYFVCVVMKQLLFGTDKPALVGQGKRARRGSKGSVGVKLSTADVKHLPGVKLPGPNSIACIIASGT